MEELLRQVGVGLLLCFVGWVAMACIIIGIRLLRGRYYLRAEPDGLAVNSRNEWVAVPRSEVEERPEPFHG